MTRYAHLQHARWSVAWIHEGKVKRVDCGEDFREARRVYRLALLGDRSNVVLFSPNVGFAPPPELQAQMQAQNARGVWWCPYCVELRKFVYKKAIRVEGRLLPDTGMYCPICGISQRDHHVRRANPAAALMEHRTTKRVAKPDDVKAAERKARRERRKARRAKERA